MDFIFFFYAPQYRYRVFQGRLAHVNRLEPAFKSRVFFDVSLVVLGSRGPDGSQPSPSQRGLEHIGSVQRSFRRSRAHQSMKFIDEEYVFSRRLFNFFDNRFQPLFKFPPKFRSRQKRAEIQGNYFLVFQVFRDIAGHDSLRQTLRDRRFSGAGFSD